MSLSLFLILMPVTFFILNIYIAYLGVLGVGGDYVFSWLNFSCLNCNILAALWYTKLQLNNIQQKKKKSTNDNKI